MTKMKLFSGNSVDPEFILNRTNFVIQITHIFETVMNPSIVQNFVAQFSMFNSLLSKKNFLACCTNNNSNMQQKNLRSSQNSSLLSKPSPKLLLNQFYNTNLENSNGPKNKQSSKYFDIDKINNIKTPNENKSLSLFLINAQFLINSLTNFDIIALRETRITKKVSLLNDLNLNKYSCEFTPTKTLQVPLFFTFQIICLIDDVTT